MGVWSIYLPDLSVHTYLICRCIPTWFVGAYLYLHIPSQYFLETKKENLSTITINDPIIQCAHQWREYIYKKKNQCSSMYSPLLLSTFLTRILLKCGRQLKLCPNSIVSDGSDSKTSTQPREDTKCVSLYISYKEERQLGVKFLSYQAELINGDQAKAKSITKGNHRFVTIPCGECFLTAVYSTK